ncbi:MAG: tRNA (adenosine(37)-N6)-dimethylallyltransferase MiaA [bacterium]|nr:tRNA (adenosine(37)-N6)-dimethylallyltransferase MiaA [bacterium]
MKHPTKVIALIGPTASGKTGFAVQAAQALGGSILSVDSRQVFKGMDLGTGKDLQEYEGVPYYGIDILDPTDDYSVAKFQANALNWLQEITGAGRVPILCGGSGHYLKALIQDYPFTAPATDRSYSEALEERPRSELEAQMDALGLSGPRDSLRRMARQIERALRPAKPSTEQPSFSEGYQIRIFALNPPRDQLRQQIGLRLDQRLAAGMVDEVVRLRALGVSDERLRRFGLEYRWILEHLLGHLDAAQMREKLYTAICQFAKRQVTFLRYLQKEGVTWEEVKQVTEFVEQAQQWLEQD